VALIDLSNFKRWQASFRADRRGAVAIETILIYPVIFLSILFPMGDLAAAAFQFISARQALHAFGQYLMYAPPDDLANTSSWMTTTLAKGNSLGYSITSFQLICGDGGAACSSTNTANPKYYSYSTSVTLSPLVLTSVLCPSSCTYTVSYSTRFQ
jgi:Flp pilus assembly protein TadG